MQNKAVVSVQQGQTHFQIVPVTTQRGRLPSLSGTTSFPGSLPCTLHCPLCATVGVNSLLPHAALTWSVYIHKKYAPQCPPCRCLAFWRVTVMCWALARSDSWNALPAFHLGSLSQQLQFSFQCFLWRLKSAVQSFASKRVLGQRAILSASDRAGDKTWVFWVWALFSSVQA